MAGKLVIDTLQDSSGNSASSTTVIQGSAKAWVNFNGVTTATIRASYNVSSVTRNSTGDYTVNFTNAMADANYAFIPSCGNTTGGGTNPSVTARTQLSTTTSARVILNGATGTAPDLDTVCVSIFR